MKTRLLHSISTAGSIVAVVVAFAPGLAAADNYVGTDFQALAAKAQSAPQFDYAAHGYRKLNLSVIGDVAWVPTAHGAEGPLRAEAFGANTTSAAASSAQLQRETDKRFYPVGGADTP